MKMRLMLYRNNSLSLPAKSFPRTMVICSLVLLTIWLRTSPVGAATLYVPAQYSTVQAAVNAAQTNDTISITEGTGYLENVTVNGKNGLRINSPINPTIQPADATKPVFSILNSIDFSLDGVMIMGSSNSSNGTIRVEGGGGFGISNCTVGTMEYPNKTWGIIVLNSYNADIRNNTIAYGTYGLQTTNVNGISIINNAIHDFTDTGLRFLDSLGGQILSNSVTQCGTGLALSVQGNAQPIHQIKNNHLYANNLNLSLGSGNLLPFLNMDSTNTVDGKPVYIFKGLDNPNVPADAGFVALYNCTNATVHDLSLTRVNPGVWLEGCSQCQVTKVNLSHVGIGVLVNGGSGNSVTNSTVADSPNSDGIQVWYSNNAVLNGNSISLYGTQSGSGIFVSNSNGVSISQNSLTGGLTGIDARIGSSLTIEYNVAQGSSKEGLYLNSVKSSTISNNQLLNNGTGISFDQCDNSSFSGNIMSGNKINFDVQQTTALASLTVDSANIVDGKSVLWLKNQSNVTVSENIGFLALVNCANMTARNFTSTKNNPGALLVDTTNSTLQNLVLEGNRNGLILYGGTGNLVDGASISNNLSYGLVLDKGAKGNPGNNSFTNNRFQNNKTNAVYFNYSRGGNTFYLNGFLSNKINASSAEAEVFSSPDAIPYQYKGKHYSSRLGNYYSDYTGPDANDDGIGDIPYGLKYIWPYPDPVLADNFPLMWNPTPISFNNHSFLPLIIKNN
jgi:parallel beta-helix repeat protein